MTIGEKIKYFRTNLGITQGKLAELSDIHPVSIRKYETNKMQPQLPQIERIAAALRVNFNALTGVSNSEMRLRTFGDLMSLLILWLNSGIIQMTGERDKDNFLEYDTVEIKFNPIFSDYLSILSNKQKNRLYLDDILLDLTSDKVLMDILKWEKCNFLYISAITSAKTNLSESNDIIINELAEIKEQVELELMRSTLPLDIRECL